MIIDALKHILAGQDLAFDEMVTVFDQIMSGKASDAQIGGFLIGLRMKGETATEVAAAASVMREKATKIMAPEGNILDTCGTGGDGQSSFNISTAVALVAAGAGVCVAKHGNKSVSSKSGSADALAQLGVNINADLNKAQTAMKEANVGFLFAPMIHGAMKYAIGARKQLAQRTIFNMLGPLTNPAGAKHQLLGVFSTEAQDKMAKALLDLGTTHAMLVCSQDGMDEISISAPTRVLEICNNAIKEIVITPEDFGVQSVVDADLSVPSSKDSAKLIADIIDGVQTDYRRDIVLINAAAAIYVADRADNFINAMQMAREAISSGGARVALDKLIAISNS